jgi:hypothetical protein
METKDIVKALERAGAALGEAETEESRFREQYNAQLSAKQVIEADLGVFGAARDRKLQATRSELVEAIKVTKARKDRVAELKQLLNKSAIEAAREEQRAFVQQAVDASGEVEVHLRALTEITRRIQEIAAREYEFTRETNARLDLFNTRYALVERLRFNTGALLPPPHVDVDVWLPYQQKSAQNLADF